MLDDDNDYDGDDDKDGLEGHDFCHEWENMKHIGCKQQKHATFSGFW